MNDKKREQTVQHGTIKIIMINKNKEEKKMSKKHSIAEHIGNRKEKKTRNSAS